MLDWKELNKKILKADRILLSTHENPDGDGLGSACAIYYYLNDIGKDCRLVQSSELPLQYEFLSRSNEIETYSPEEHDKWMKNVDLALIFDVGDFSRLRDVGKVLSKNQTTAINIDHHPDQKNKNFSYDYIDINAAATGEMVYDFFITNNIEITKIMAQGIYTAVMTDTGSFRYSNTSQKSHQIAIESINRGVNVSKIYQDLYENKSPGQVALLAQILNNLNYDFNGELAWFTVTKKMLDETGAVKKDVDGFTDYVRAIRGVEVAVMVFEYEFENCRINLRSKGKYVINNIAKSLGGGGHKFAAGASSKKSLNEVVSHVLKEARSSMAEQNT